MDQAPIAIATVELASRQEIDLLRQLLPGLRVTLVAAPAPVLTPRQQAILALLAEGRSNKAIARALGLSPHTVRNHLSALFRLLGARNRAEAVLAHRQRTIGADHGEDAGAGLDR